MWKYIITYCILNLSVQNTDKVECFNKSFYDIDSEKVYYKNVDTLGVFDLKLDSVKIDFKMFL
jgi:hypothetical protein